MNRIRLGSGDRSIAKARLRLGNEPEPSSQVTHEPAAVGKEDSEGSPTPREARTWIGDEPRAPSADPDLRKGKTHG